MLSAGRDGFVARDRPPWSQRLTGAAAQAAQTGAIVRR